MRFCAGNCEPVQKCYWCWEREQRTKRWKALMERDHIEDNLFAGYLGKSQNDGAMDRAARLVSR